MRLEEFQQLLQPDALPPELPLLLAALWWDAKGDWTKAHECAQQRATPDHAWVHAYLHRKEGDADNARYWYGRAGRPVFSGAFEEEWRQIAEALVSGHSDPSRG